MKRVAMDARQLREFLAALDPGWECEQQDGAKCPWPVKLVAGEYRARWEKVGPRTAKVGWFAGDEPEFTPHLTHDAFDLYAEWLARDALRPVEYVVRLPRAHLAGLLGQVRSHGWTATKVPEVPPKNDSVVEESTRRELRRLAREQLKLLGESE